MPQVLKPAVRTRIEQAALQSFADHGYAGSSVAAIAAAAGTAPANVYRYFADKAELFSAVVPAEVASRHDELLDSRVTALAMSDPAVSTSAASALLDFWLEHRLAVVILLDQAAGTPYAGYPEAFVARLVGHVQRGHARRLSALQRELLELVFDNTRRAISRILRSTDDPDRIRELIAGFWSYQLPGLDGLMRHLGGPAAS